MALLSLRRFMDAGNDFEAAVRRVPSLLLEALALQAVEGDAAEREQFQASLRQLGDELEKAKDAQRVLVNTGEIIRVLDSYSRALGRYWRSQGTELHSIITLLTNKLIGMADSSDLSCRKLVEIEKSLQGTSQIEDLKLLRARLVESLTGLQQEASRHASQASAIRSEAQTLRQTAKGASAMAWHSSRGPPVLHPFAPS